MEICITEKRVWSGNDYWLHVGRSGDDSIGAHTIEPLLSPAFEERLRRYQDARGRPPTYAEEILKQVADTLEYAFMQEFADLDEAVEFWSSSPFGRGR